MQFISPLFRCRHYDSKMLLMPFIAFATLLFAAVLCHLMPMTPALTSRRVFL